MKNQSLYIANDKIDLIALLNEEKMEDKGLKEFKRKVYKKNEYIYLPGETANQIYIIKEGRVKIGNHSESAKAIIKNVLRVGELFGEFSLIGQSSRVDFAIAMEVTELYVLNLSELNKLMQDHDSLMAYIINILGTRLIAMEQKVESFVFKSSRTRIIDFLNDLAKKRGQRIGYEMVVRKFFTHQEIANITATSRQTVTTVLNELRNKNIITFNQRRLLIRDLNLLRAEVS